VVPTHNRSLALKRALDSIWQQTLESYEVIVVDDGSKTDVFSQNEAIVNQFDERFSIVNRSIWEPKHGPSYSRNTGFSYANGQYIGFLDDDDFWCDNQHLEIAQKAILETGCDFYLCDQIAKRNDEVVVREWLPHLNNVSKSREKLNNSECYRVNVTDVLKPEGIGFPHVNTVFMNRKRFEQIKGFWDGSPYEEDLDFFLRLLDVSDGIVYRPVVVAITSLREKKSEDGASSIDDELKMLYRILVCNHARLSVSGEVQKYAKLLQAGVFKTIAKNRYKTTDYKTAADYAFQAAALELSIKWVVISIYLKVRNVFLQ